MRRSQMRMFRLCVFSLKVHPGRIPLVGLLVTKSNYINLSANNDSDLRARQVGQPLQTSDHDNTRLLITIAPRVTTRVGPGFQSASFLVDLNFSFVPTSSYSRSTAIASTPANFSGVQTPLPILPLKYIALRQLTSGYHIKDPASRGFLFGLWMRIRQTIHSMWFQRRGVYVRIVALRNLATPNHKAPKDAVLTGFGNIGVRCGINTNVGSNNIQVF